jgi:hypothetical protein
MNDPAGTERVENLILSQPPAVDELQDLAVRERTVRGEDNGINHVVKIHKRKPQFAIAEDDPAVEEAPGDRPADQRTAIIENEARPQDDRPKSLFSHCVRH